MEQNLNVFNPGMMEEPPTPTGIRGVRQTRSARGRGGSGLIPKRKNTCFTILS